LVRRPLGDGDVDGRAFVGFLEGVGYDRWYACEQDVMLGADPPDGAGPLDDVRASAELLRLLLGAAART
jgi:inosose dehydratase